MKRIILSLGVLLMIAQNGFAQHFTDIEYDRLIANSTGVIQQKIKCEKVAYNHVETGSPKECVKAVEMIKKSHNQKDKEDLSAYLYNAGLLYYWSKGNKIKSYEYWYEAAKFGNKGAQKNLSIMCKQNPWACK